VACLSLLPRPSAHAAEPAFPDTTFLAASTARQAIGDDSLQPYFSLLEPMEMSAKTGTPIGGGTLEEQRAECRRRYQAAVREFTPEEQAVIRRHVQALQSALMPHYPRLMQLPWSFLKAADQIEGGLPHTHGPHIVLSAGVCAQILAGAKAAGESALLPRLLEVLIHEQVHVFQRTHVGHMDSLYEKQWGFVNAGPIAGCPWLKTHQLVNPDATECVWVVPDGSAEGKGRFLWPLASLAEGEEPKRMPQDLRIIVVSVERVGDEYRARVGADGKPVLGSLEDAPTTEDLRHLDGMIYHPRESAAKVFARIVIYDHFLDHEQLAAEQRQQAERFLGPLRAWFRAHLATGS